MGHRAAAVEGRDRYRVEVARRALAHMVQAIERAWPDDSPFPNFIAEGIFPDDLYGEMLTSLPESRLYRPAANKKRAHRGVNQGWQFPLTSEFLKQLLGRQRSLWLGVRDALGAPEFKQAVFRQLSTGLAYRYQMTPDEAAEMPGFPMPELIREDGNGRTKPHSDGRRKVVVVQIALPPDNSQSDQGTEFYRRSYSPLSLLREPRGFHEAKRSPFLPNVAYGFAVLNNLMLKSWHGRFQSPGTAGVRNTLVNDWFAEPEDANSELVEQYYRGL